jgi:hypothetical protein
MKSKLWKIGALIFSQFLLAGTAGATGGSNLIYTGSIFAVGSQATSTCFVGPTTNTASCLYGLIYFDCSTDAGKAEYAAALMAYTLGKTISVDFNQDNSGVCNSVNFLYAH